MTASNLAIELFWSLPHDLRRVIYTSIRRRQAANFRRMRFDRSITRGNCLAQFDDTKSIFVHIPKCAGVALSNSLYGGRWAGHLRVLHYQAAFCEAEFNRYFKFAIVRNPWDRVYSAYRFLAKGGLTADDAEWAAANIAQFDSFDEFVKRWLNKTSAETQAHFIPQFRFICAPGSQQHLMDFIGRFERLTDDFNIIKRRVHPGAKGEAIELASLNRTGPAPVSYVEAFTTESRDIVADVYAKDIALLGYRFGEAAPADYSKMHKI